MKLNLLMGLMVATLSFTHMSHANITLHSNEQNVCEDISGRWSGAGNAYNWYIGECKYHGAGIVSPSDNTGTFSVEVIATKDSGSFFCPGQATEYLTGSCVNGVFTMKSQYGDLTGNFSKNEGNAFGTLSVGPGMNADVKIKFTRNQ